MKKDEKILSDPDFTRQFLAKQASFKNLANSVFNDLVYDLKSNAISTAIDRIASALGASFMVGWEECTRAYGKDSVKGREVKKKAIIKEIILPEKKQND